MRNGNSGLPTGFMDEPKAEEMRPQDFSTRIRYRPPKPWYRRLNRLSGLLLRAGIGPRDSVVLEVPGRTSGRLRHTPLLLTTLGDHDFLVALAGESEWVRNVANASGRVTIGRRRRRSAELLLVPERERAEVIIEYLATARRRSGDRAAEAQADSYFGLGSNPDLEAIRPIAGLYPVFRVQYT